MSLPFMVVGIIFILIGITLTLGLGWAVILLDLFGEMVTGDYSQIQKSYTGTKNRTKRKIGILLIFIGTIIVLRSL